MANEARILRRRVEDVSRPLLIRLSSLPRLLIPLLTTALVAIGLFAPLAVSLVALLLVLVFLGWITYLAWPVVPGSGRALRVILLVLVVGLAYLRIGDLTAG